MKKAILVISFGTSYRETLERTIGAVEEDIRRAYPKYEVRRAFTSGMIIKKLRERDGVETDTVSDALEKLVNEGFGEVICAVTHIINGFEYDKIIKSAKIFSDRINIKITRPLVSLTEDYAEVIKAIGHIFDNDKIYILMGHGTEHFANAAYPALDYHFKTDGFDNVYVGTVEGFPELGNIIDEIKKQECRNAVLMPFMLVAGDHAINDMAVEWKEALEAEGFSVECIMRGLGEYKGIRNLYIKRVEDEKRGAEHF